ncbi:MAG: InlB B-repeat-containing protein, partial [Acholeplasmataceae bacterium]|nr:InlB B-repeat-containing protein [Acholeplasmataceae bacterium]
MNTIYLFNTVVDKPLTLFAKWEALPTYTVTIGGNTQIIVENGFVVKPQDPNEFGKIFEGWFVGLNEFDFTTPITENLVIEAKFIDAQVFSITFESNEGSLVSPIQFYENQKITQLPKPTKDLYRFSNWYLDSELTLLFNQEYLESSITLYAKYVLMGELIFEENFSYAIGTHLGATPWNEVKPGSAIIESTQTLKLTELATEATYEQHLSSLADGRYVLVFDFMQGIGGASFTIEMIHNTTRIFTVGANRANRYTYRNQDGSETAVNASIVSVTPNLYHQAIVIFDTEYNTYKYFIRVNENLFEITPAGGVGFASDLDITQIRIRIVGHSNAPSTDPTTYLKNLLIESSSETENGKSSFDPEEAIDYETLVNDIYNSLAIPFANDIRSNISLPLSISNVSITWQSSNTAIISNTGLVTRDETDDIHVSLTATISKAGYTMVKEIEVLVKSQQAAVFFDEKDYQLTGFALGHVSIPNLVEGQPGYYVANNEIEFMNAINAENSTSQGTTAARIIEIRANLNLGYLEMTNQYGVIRNLESHATPKMHPILKQTGVGKIVIQDRDGSNSKYHEGLVIFSESGHTIKHAAFTIKRANNIVIRNLKFDELWEWDEAT